MSHHRREPRLVVAVVLAMCVSGSVGLAPVHAAGAVIDSAPQGHQEAVDDLPRGRLLTHRPIRTAATLPSARRTELVTYISKGVAGRPVVVSGTVSLPKSAPPARGWPVLSWAHGTTGTADECAPSADTVRGPAHDYLGDVSQTLDQWVSRGFAVVQTDYEGLGTPGDHPYMNGPSARRTVIDIVRAARQLDRRVGRDYVVAGHSQGGHAALFAGGTPTRAGDVRLRGVVAIAPGGVGLSQTAPYIQGNLPGADHAVSFLPPLLLGTKAARSGLRISGWLTEKGNHLLDAGRTGCLAAIRQASADIKAVEVFRPGADLTPLGTYLRSQELPGPRLRVPAMIAQGTADISVTKASIDQLVASLCERNTELVYRVYEPADHRGAVTASFSDSVKFARRVMRGKTPASTCA